MVIPGGRKRSVESADLLVLRDYLIQTVMNSVQISWPFQCVNRHHSFWSLFSERWKDSQGGQFPRMNWTVKRRGKPEEFSCENHFQPPGSSAFALHTSGLILPKFWSAMLFADQTNRVSTAERTQGASWEQLGNGDISPKGMRISSISWGTPVIPRGYLDGGQY